MKTIPKTTSQAASERISQQIPACCVAFFIGKHARLLSFLLILCTHGWTQNAPPPTPQNPANASQAAEQPENEAPSFTFKAITQLVVVDMEARDPEDNPVRGLTAKDIQVTERIGDSKELPQQVSVFQEVSDYPAQKTRETGGIRLTAPIPVTQCESGGARYELTYYLSPESRKDGFHQIFVKSRRSDLKFHFRRGYKIEAGKSAVLDATTIADTAAQKQLRDVERAQNEAKKNPGMALAAMACYDTFDTAPLSIKVRQIAIQPDEVATYELLAGPKSLGLLSSAHNYRVRLELAICTFDSSAHPLRYFESNVDQTLTESQYQSAITSGFPHTIELPITGAYSARLLVRNLANGALGTAELQVIPVPRHDTPIFGNLSTTGSLGTVSPISAALCGDVYTVPPWTLQLPRFSELQPIGALYANSLAVLSWPFTEGIPDVTSRTEWFAINYLGDFWVDEPEDYEFGLFADDRAKLYIDEKLILYSEAERMQKKIHLNTGQHRIRIAYLQGTRTQVALVLALKTPGHDWKLFDTRDFPRPPDSPVHGPKLQLPNL